LKKVVLEEWEEGKTENVQKKGIGVKNRDDIMLHRYFKKRDVCGYVLNTRIL